VVRYRAGVTILALTDVKRIMLATRFRIAGILRAFVSIVAGRFVNHAIAVIVDSVAVLRARLGCTAHREPTLFTDSQASALSPFVAQRAGRVQLEGS